MIKTASKRVRRTEDEHIADLEAKIAALKRKAEEKKVKRDPALRHINAAVKAIDKATAESQDSATRQALAEARATLSACLSLNGALPGVSRGVLVPRSRIPGGPVKGETLLEHIRKNPGQRGEQIAAALGTDTRTMRPVMHGLIAEKKVRTEGERRGMSYHPAK